jgi:hypothetical protein
MSQMLRIIDYVNILKIDKEICPLAKKNCFAIRSSKPNIPPTIIAIIKNSTVDFDHHVAHSLSSMRINLPKPCHSSVKQL